MVTENDILVRINVNESCDECLDDPEIVEGLYNGEVIYSVCMHDSNDFENIREDIIDTVMDIMEHRQAQDE